jgi:hypothetical protein
MDMRRLLAIAVPLLLAASVQLNAQRGGGHGSVGGHGGFSGHSISGGHFSGGHAFGGGHSGFSAPRSFSGGRSFNRQSSNRQFATRGRNFRNHSGVGLRIRTRGFRNGCYGYRCGWGWGYPYLGGGLDPYWWWDSGSYDQDQQEQIGLANEMNAQSLDEQRSRQQPDQDSYSRPAPAARQAEQTDPAPATVLVFRDQHKQEIQNWARRSGIFLRSAPRRFRFLNWILRPQRRRMKTAA